MADKDDLMGVEDTAKRDILVAQKDFFFLFEDGKSEVNMPEVMRILLAESADSVKN